MATIVAQIPGAFNYQAVLRDIGGEEIVNTQVGMQVSILQGSETGTVVYIESYTPTSNNFGLVILEIGKGTVVSGDFALIDWAAGPYYLKTELDISGGTTYEYLGTSQLMSVPYALQAKNAENVFSGDYNDLDNLPDFTDWDIDASDDFNGNYGDLDNLPEWSDSLDTHVEDAVFLEGVVESGNLLTFDGVNWIARDIVLGNTGGGQAFNNLQPYLVMNYCIALMGVYPARDQSEPFLGTIALFGFYFNPRGWAKCDGQLLSIASNQALFSLLGTYYGGDGRTTFGLPDLRGRVPIHMGTGPGLPAYNIGQKGGTPTTTFVVPNLPLHTHSVIYE